MAWACVIRVEPRGLASRWSETHQARSAIAIWCWEREPAISQPCRPGPRNVAVSLLTALDYAALLSSNFSTDRGRSFMSSRPRTHNVRVTLQRSKRHATSQCRDSGVFSFFFLRDVPVVAPWPHRSELPAALMVNMLGLREL